MPSTSVKVFSSADPGALVLAGVAGSLSAIIRSCLVEGRGTAAVQSLVVSGGIATATYATDHPFSVDSVGLFAGATPIALNGEQRILSVVSPNVVTFVAPGVPDGAATGSITSKLAAAGWSELFAGTANILVVCSSALEATGACLRIDDTGTTNARVSGYLTMTGVSAGLGQFPENAKVAGGMFWHKSNAANATARAWELIADDKTFYLHICTNPTVNLEGGMSFTFGDFLSRRAGDFGGCLISGSPTDVATSAVVQATTLSALRAVDNTSLGIYAARSYTGIGASAELVRRSQGLAIHGNSAAQTLAAGGVQYPNGSDNSLILQPTVVCEVGTSTLRGRMRGLYSVPQPMLNEFVGGSTIPGQGDLADRTMRVMKDGAPAGTTAVGALFLDTTGPWG